LDKYDIHLISHTDPIGGKEYNDWLSKMRSEAVRQILFQKEIPERKITIKDWGLENPVYSNNSYQGMQMNRRVDVILYPIIFWKCRCPEKDTDLHNRTFTPVTKVILS